MIFNVSAFHPFDSREEDVLSFRFSYNANAVADLKYSLEKYKQLCFERSGQKTAGAWLSDYQCWFVEPCIYQEVKGYLEFRDHWFHLDEFAEQVLFLTGGG